MASLEPVDSQELCGMTSVVSVDLDHVEIWRPIEPTKHARSRTSCSWKTVGHLLPRLTQQLVLIAVVVFAVVYSFYTTAVLSPNTADMVLEDVSSWYRKSQQAVLVVIATSTIVTVGFVFSQSHRNAKLKRLKAALLFSSVLLLLILFSSPRAFEVRVASGVALSTDHVGCVPISDELREVCPTLRGWPFVFPLQDMGRLTGTLEALTQILTGSAAASIGANYGFIAQCPLGLRNLLCDDSQRPSAPLATLGRES